MGLLSPTDHTQWGMRRCNAEQHDSLGTTSCPALTTNELTVTHVLLLVLGLLERVRLSVSHHDPGVGDVSG